MHTERFWATNKKHSANKAQNHVIKNLHATGPNRILISNPRKFNGNSSSASNVSGIQEITAVRKMEINNEIAEIKNTEINNEITANLINHTTSNTQYMSKVFEGAEC